MSLNSTNLFIQSAPLPATFRGSPNDMFAEMIKRMKILSPTGTNFIFVGDTAPTSNVGPWLKNGTQWWVWDSNTKEYVPQDLSASLVITPEFLIGASTPVATFPPVWLQTTLNPTTADPNNYGAAIRWYVYNGAVGEWLSQHPVEAMSAERRIFTALTEAEVWSYEGGDGTNPAIFIPSDTTGAMWEVDHQFDFRMPVGAGTSLTTYNGNPATVISPSSVGGEEQHTLTVGELATHDHGVIAPNNALMTNVAGAVGFVGTIPNAAVVTTFTPSGSDQAHQNMPPFRGVYFIKRTARRFYVG